jgi:hypothetical protein
VKMKPKTTLKLEELLHALEPVRKYIPIEKFDQFYLRVYSASAEDGVGIKVLAKEIRQRIVVSSQMLSDRTGHRLIGPSKVGRPSKDRLKVLVSLVAFAYVSATGKSYRRQWDSDTKAKIPFHHILEVIFVSLCIEDSVDEAIRRQRTKQQLSEEKYT